MLPLVAVVYLIGSTVIELYTAQRARKPPPAVGVLSDQGPSGSMADQCRRTDKPPPPPLSAAASLRRAITLRWFALHTKLGGKPSPGHPAGAEGSSATDAGAEESLSSIVGLVVGNRVEHAKHGKGTVSSANGRTNNHPVYADGTPLGVLIEFDNGETHSYKQAAWDKLTVLAPKRLEGKGGDSLSEGEASRVEQVRLLASPSPKPWQALALSLGKP